MSEVQEKGKHSGVKGGEKQQREREEKRTDIRQGKNENKGRTRIIEVEIKPCNRCEATSQHGELCSTIRC
jgi:hypothetical protein